MGAKLEEWGHLGEGDNNAKEKHPGDFCCDSLQVMFG